KRGGRALYDYARAGEPVEAAPRAVVVHELTLTSFAGPEAAAFSMRCSKGTYVRALARDLGRALGVGGRLSSLPPSPSLPPAPDAVRAALAGRGAPPGRGAGRAGGG